MTPTNITYTLRHDLCTGCGVCEGACPAEAISTSIRKGRFLPMVDEAKCLGDKCGRCLKACPGVGVDLKRIAEETYRDEGVKEDRLVGRYLQCFSGHSNDHDVRFHCASGGMVSQFLIFLLEQGVIDGAVVTGFAEDHLTPQAFIARTREEVLSAKSSKYCPVSLHHAAQDIKAAEGSRFVVVGLPCHIQGFRKLEAIDKRLAKKVVGHFGIYCSSGRTFYLTEHVLKERHIDPRRLTYFAYRDEGCLGYLVARQRDERAIKITHRNFESPSCLDAVYKTGFQNYYHPLRSFFIPRRCLLCTDHYAELADVSFGDIHVEPYIADKVGVNSLVVRSEQWKKLLEEARKADAVSLEEISVEVVNSSQAMAYKKKGRNARFVALNKRLGRVVPAYDKDIPAKAGLRDVLNYAQNRFQQFVGRHKSLWWVITLLKKDTSKLR